MELQRNLETIKSINDRDVESFMATAFKVELNNLLFQFMPPTSTLRDVEDLAVAVTMTVQSAWDDRKEQPCPPS